MTKILLIISAFIILVFVVVAIYCAMIVAGRSDECDNDGDNNKENDGILCKKTN